MGLSETPRYLPDQVLDWAADHGDLLEIVVGELLEHGEWPSTQALTRKLAREGRAVALNEVLSGMPKPIGFVENYPGRIVLLLFGIRLTTAGQGLLDGFTAVLQTAIERYRGPGDEPAIRRADLVPSAPNANYVGGLSEILLREAPFLGSGSGDPGDDWHREVTDDVVRYWNAESADDYLSMRARELLGVTQQKPRQIDPLASRLDSDAVFPQPITTSSPAVSSENFETVRDVFISHASEDKDIIARPLAEELLRRGHSVWFDEYELVLGDSLRNRIDEGLARSAVGVVVLSHAFFAKPWPKRELDGLTARLVGGEKNVIVPIWHGLTGADLLGYSPPLADLLAGNSGDGVEVLVQHIERVLERRRGAQVETAPPRPTDRPEPLLAPRAATRGSGEPVADQPGDVHDQTLELIRHQDWIGLDELLRRRRHAFQSAIESVTSDHINHHTDETTVRDAWGRLSAASDRRVASLIPLALHRAQAIEVELRADAGWTSRVPLRGGSMTWQEAWRMPFWTIGMTLGALLVRLERYDAIKSTLSTVWTNRYQMPEPYVGHPGEISDAVAAVFGPNPPDGQRWSFPAWSWLVADLRTKQWLTDRYPEWRGRDDEPQASLTEFAMLVNISLGLIDEGPHVAFWSLNPEAAQRYARQLHGDDRLRTQAAVAVGTTLEIFDERGPGILRAARGIGMFPAIAETANLLATGMIR